MLAWKKLPDHFYFIKFFDPYIKREYEVLRTATATNGVWNERTQMDPLMVVPPDVREKLVQRYEYLVTEKEMVADLTDTFRSCCVCTQWAASQESVRCEWVLNRIALMAERVSNTTT